MTTFNHTLVASWILAYPIGFAIASYFIDKYILKREVRFISKEAHFGRALIRGMFIFFNCWMATNYIDLALVFAVQGLVFMGVFDPLMSKLIYKDYFAIGGTSVTDKIKKWVVARSNNVFIKDILIHLIVVAPLFIAGIIYSYIIKNIEKFYTFTIFTGN